MLEPPIVGGSSTGMATEVASDGPDVADDTAANSSSRVTC